MTDSHCRRHGYDSTGKYHVPEVYGTEPEFTQDQCDECRSAPGQPCHPDCPGTAPDEIRAPIPLATQVEQYMDRVDSVLDRLRTLLADGTDFRRHIIALGLVRLVENYELYGSAMYSWDAATRTRNMDEEVADFGVYGTSGAME